MNETKRGTRNNNANADDVIYWAEHFYKNTRGKYDQHEYTAEN